jgi:Spy/CpxP family protein refolding chaperone
MTSQGRTKLIMWTVLVAVFLLGSVTGAALSGLIRSRASSARDAHERSASERFAKMRTELNLTDQQSTQIKTILDDTKNEYKTLRTELKPRFDEPRLKARAKIRALLTPEQQQKFDAIVAGYDSRREEEEKSKR